SHDPVRRVDLPQRHAAQHDRESDHGCGYNNRGAESAHPAVALTGTDHDAQRDRDQAVPGLERGVTTYELEVLGEQEHRAEQREEREADRSGPEREPQVPEELEIKHRGNGDPLPNRESNTEYHGETERRQHQQVEPPA